MGKKKKMAARRVTRIVCNRRVVGRLLGRWGERWGERGGERGEVAFEERPPYSAPPPEELDAIGEDSSVDRISGNPDIWLMHSALRSVWEREIF